MVVKLFIIEKALQDTTLVDISLLFLLICLIILIIKFGKEIIIALRDKKKGK